MLLRNRVPARAIMASKNLLNKPSPFVPLPKPPSTSSRSHLSFTYRLIFSPFPSKRVSRIAPFAIRSSGLSYTSHARVPRSVPEVCLENPNVNSNNSLTFNALIGKLKNLGFDASSCRLGEETRLLCPRCKGNSSEKSLSILITEDGGEARWNCFQGKCRWRGVTQAFGDAKSSYGMMNKTEVEEKWEITEESLELEPLSEQLVVWFSARMISRETLRRNRVMQRRRDNQIVIAFTYRRNGLLVNCKYRDVTKQFSQVKGAEKIFYGLDDIEGASEIIIVEGEMDKLSMEEAGFRNCVSVPDGAPRQVSSKGVPPEKSDKKYQYLWNCKKYLEKASRIILATDGDLPGQALAEELARRLGREKCWRIVWPKKNENERFKDANEVLMIMGPNALREVIESVELYPIKGLFNFKDYFDEIDAYYHQTLGYELGVSTGWKALNDLYNCKGGVSSEMSLSILITVDGVEARWTCFRGKCGWRGMTLAFGDAKSSYGMMNKTELEEKREITEESLGLEPLSEQLVVWFSARMISRETLRRNRVMQRRRDNQVVIAFTYRRNGLLVNCKYRDITKRFSQVVISLSPLPLTFASITGV